MVIIVYLLVIAAMGAALARLNRGGDDFFRAGGRGTWWLVGASVFMAGISARTFTESAGIAFEAGWTVMVIYVAGAIASLLHFFYFGPRFRQTRSMTFPELIRDRFGVVTEQIYSLLQIPMSLMLAGLWLWGLSIFVGSAFGLAVPWVILGVGLVVLFCSATGGLWAVMATDFVQGLMLVAVATLMAMLAIAEIGGVGELISRMSELGDDVLFKPSGMFPGDLYTWPWAAAMVVYTVTILCSIEGAVRYFAVKDGGSARGAALLHTCLMLALPIIFIIPPFVARLLWSDEVLAAPGADQPAETAYAVASRHLLPSGMLGLMVVAMFSATMSSMDSGLNRNAAIVVRNILPAVMRRLGRAMPSDAAQLLIGRLATICCGLTVIAIAWFYTRLQGGVFEITLLITATLFLPLAVPLLMGILIRRTPGWSALVSAAAAAAPAVWATFFAAESWPYHWKVFTVMPAGIIGFLITMPFWRHASAAERGRINAFFERMNTPVDFEREVGRSDDRTLMRTLGLFAMMLGGSSLLLLLIPGDQKQVMCVLWVAGIQCVVGGVLWGLGQRQPRPQAADPVVLPEEMPA